MTLEMSGSLLDEIRRALARAYPDEGCGLLFGERDGAGRVVVQGHLALPNRWSDGSEAPRRYLITPEDLRAAERAARAASFTVVGTYHSHPDAPARPSPFDVEHAWPWYRYLIVSVKRGLPDEARVWELRDDRGGFTEHALEVRDP